MLSKRYTSTEVDRRKRERQHYISSAEQRDTVPGIPQITSDTCMLISQ